MFGKEYFEGLADWTVKTFDRIIPDKISKLLLPSYLGEKSTPEKVKNAVRYCVSQTILIPIILISPVGKPVEGVIMRVKKEFDRFATELEDELFNSTRK